MEVSKAIIQEFSSLPFPIISPSLNPFLTLLSHCMPCQNNYILVFRAGRFGRCEPTLTSWPCELLAANGKLQA